MLNEIKNKIVKSSVMMIVAIGLSFSVTAQDFSIKVQAGAVDIIKIQDLMKIAPGSTGGAGGSRVIFSAAFNNPTGAIFPVAKGDMRFMFSYNGKKVVELYNNSKLEFPVGRMEVNSNTISKSTFFNFKTDGDLDPNTIASVFGKKKEDISLTSPVPSGDYTVKIWIKNTSIEDEATLTLSNIESNVVIIGPGDEMNSGDIPELNDKQPLISWTGGSPAYEVRVIEKGDNQNTLGDLLAKEANFRETVNAQSIKYPSAGVKPLQPGKTYVVVVASVVKDFGSSADTRKWSAPFIFKIKEQQTGSESASNQLVDALRRISGSQYDAAFDQLKDATPTGKLFLDDKSIGVNDLRDIMSKIQAQTYNLKSIAIK